MFNVFKFKMLENYTKKSIFVYFDYQKNDSNVYHSNKKMCIKNGKKPEKGLW